MSEANADSPSAEGLRDVINDVKLLEEKRKTEKPNEDRVIRRKHAIAKTLLEKTKDLAITDTLTGLHNRRWFEDDLQRRMAIARRTSQPLYLAYIDFDDFKNINSTFGHDGGDGVLKLISSVQTRPDEPISRYGGDEFVQLIGHNGLTLDEMAQVIERHKTKVLETSRVLLEKASLEPGITPKDAKREISLSIGLAKYEGEDTESFIKKANKALLHTKRHGKNAAFIAQNGTNGEEVSFIQVTK